MGALLTGCRRTYGALAADGTSIYGIEFMKFMKCSVRVGILVRVPSRGAAVCNVIAHHAVILLTCTDSSVPSVLQSVAIRFNLYVILYAYRYVVSQHVMISYHVM